MSAPGPKRKEYDRSITEGPLGPAVWKLAWPTVVTNVIGGLQGVIDHAMVGNYVGFTGNAAIGVSWQIFLIVIVFISSLFSGMSVLVARFAGAGDHDKVDRTVYQAFLTAIFMSLGVLAPIGYFGAPVLLGLVNASQNLVNVTSTFADHPIDAVRDLVNTSYVPAMRALMAFNALLAAIGIACSSAAGIKSFTQGSGGMVKRMHAGRGAEAGVLACLLLVPLAFAAAGFLTACGRRHGLRLRTAALAIRICHRDHCHIRRYANPDSGNIRHRQKSF